MLVANRDLTLDELQATVNEMDQPANQRTDLMTVIESRLFEQNQKMMVPTQQPVQNATRSACWHRSRFGNLGFAYRADFAAETGTAITSAAGGAVQPRYHPQYGNMISTTMATT